MTSRRAPPGHVRIIGGRLRGSRLPVHEHPGLRPTSDRVRETLFNWLAPVLPGARCLDAFAGSGALGIEAISRGAADVVLLERDPRLARSLTTQIERLHIDNARIITADALAWLGREPDHAFDVVFLDPPFASEFWIPLFERLPAWLASNAWVYIESPRASTPVVPTNWELHREGRTGEARYALYHTHQRT